MSPLHAWPLWGMVAFLAGWFAGLVGIPLTTRTLMLNGIVAAFVGAFALIALVRKLSHRAVVQA